MLRIYCPDLLDSFEEAVANRAAWVTQHRNGFTSTLKYRQMSTTELQTMVDRMEGTLRDLLSVRADLRRLIQESYPVLSADSQNSQ